MRNEMRSRVRTDSRPSRVAQLAWQILSHRCRLACVAWLVCGEVTDDFVGRQNVSQSQCGTRGIGVQLRTRPNVRVEFVEFRPNKLRQSFRTSTMNEPAAAKQSWIFLSLPRVSHYENTLLYLCIESVINTITMTVEQQQQESEGDGGEDVISECNQEHYAEAILKAAGILIDCSTSSSPLQALEQWLGLSQTKQTNGVLLYEGLTVEDCAPLDPVVYQITAEWMRREWMSATAAIAAAVLRLPNTLTSTTAVASAATTTTESTNTSNEKNDFNNQSQITTTAAVAAAAVGAVEVTLEDLIPSVRATRYLRHWMDLNVDPDNNATMTLSHYLLQTDELSPTPQQQQQQQQSPVSFQPDSSSTTQLPVATRPRPLPLLHAFYQHIQDLPILQAHMHRYIQSLLQQHQYTNPSSKASATSTLLRDPKERLEQYARVQAMGQRLSDEWQAHVDRLQFICGEWYRVGSTNVRSYARRGLGRVWLTYIYDMASTGGSGMRQENTRAAGIQFTLRVLHRILLGIAASTNSSEKKISTDLPSAYVDLLFTILVPLHKPDAMVLWRDQTSVLELYHEPLTQCCATLLQLQPSLLPRLVDALLDKEIFPPTGNTSKQVLLLHELDIYIKLLKDPTFRAAVFHANKPPLFNSESSAPILWTNHLLTVLARCVSSDNSRLAERALDFFRNTAFEGLVSGSYVENKQDQLAASLRILLPALLRRSWNPTVQKRTYHVLEILQKYDETVFAQVCNQEVTGDSAGPLNALATDDATKPARSSLLESISSPGQQPLPTDFSLKSAMGSWKPPAGGTGNSAVSHHTAPSTIMPPPSSKPPTVIGQGKAPWTGTRAAPPSRQAPPLTVTGVAPWAVSAPSLRHPQPPIAPTNTGSQQQQPPVTVTGVAPWAISGAAAPTRRKRSAPINLPSLPAGHGPTNSTALDEEPLLMDPTNEDSEIPPAPLTGFAYVQSFMESIKPPPEETGASSWSKVQMEETPTLLPNLKFHDLVFGHDLGSGAFGSVRYARLIDKNKTRSHWAEYAVKVISTTKIRELGYEASVQREIAVLRVLSHPGIARLVSSFRFQEGAYLVLEYASGGDLHHLLRKHGSLDHDSTRFVMGEVVAALASIHELGLVYADLKTENILLTEPGHIKLTDFGGCRPITVESREMVRTVSKNILKNLRDGGWKPETKQHGTNGEASVVNEEEEEEEEEEDLRVEGTMSYLPPEVVLGGTPTYAADAWALGCVTYQCLSGRPPFLEDDDEATRQRIVKFNTVQSGSGDQFDRLFQERHAADISPSARELIQSLLTRDPSMRPDMHQVAESLFFTEANVDVFTLYSKDAYPLDVGTVGPAPDAKWTRRQFSSIWAPQPQAYDIAMPISEVDKDKQIFNDSTAGPISEGEEAAVFFSPTGEPQRKLKQISEQLPPRTTTVRPMKLLPPQQGE